MKKHHKTLKVSAITCLVLVSFFIILIPTSSAALFGMTSNVKMNYKITENMKVVPLSGQLSVPINVSYQIEGVFAKAWEGLLGSLTATVDIRVKETPQWATALVTPNVVTPDISTTWKSEEAYVHISFDATAQANDPVVIIIEMTASAPISRIRSVTKSFEISFTPTFLPIIDVNPKTVYKEVSPGEIAVFDIELENLGNAETEFLFTVTEVPKTWTASIVSNTKVDSTLAGGSGKKTVTLSVTPPYDFGYHNEIVEVKISVTGRYYAGKAAGPQETEIPEITFQVRNRGFSTPGFDIVIVLIGLISVIFIMKKFNKRVV
jgi:hypothetical protein